MEGLEAAEVQKSAINNEERYEAEFFRKRFIAEDKALSSLPQRSIGEFATVTDGPHGYHVVDESSNIVMLTAKNAIDWFADREAADPIAEHIDLQNKRSSLQVGNVILSTRGTVGRCALVTEEALPANIDQDVARISWANNDDFIPEFVVAYLNSAFGQDRILRYASGMVQQGLSLQKVRDIPLPRLSRRVQQAIAATVTAALQQRRNSKDKYAQAETLLLRELGLENWQPPEPLAYTQKASEAFAAGRLDAEFFRPRCSALQEELSRRFELKTLNEAGQVLKGVTIPYHEDGTLPIIRSGDLVDISDDTRFLKSNLTEPVFRLHLGDVLISSIGFGSIGKVQVFDKTGIYGTVSEVTVVRQRQINPYYLAFFLRSSIGQMQLEQHITRCNWNNT